MATENGRHGGSPPPHPGFFLVLDGPDGGGKTTQAARLANWLRERGVDVVTCRDPGSTALGDRLRNILLDRDSIALSMRSEMLLFMASRAQLVEEVIRPALQAGRLVICDRFTLSNIVYQGHAGGLGVQPVDLIGQVATGQLFPDLTLILDVLPDVARSRVGKARDRMEDRPAEYHRRVREGFLEAARENADREAERMREKGKGVVMDLDSADEPEGDWSGRFCRYPDSPIRVIDATADPDRVFEQITSEVQRVLALDPRA
jgi:dTMP kinase